jgi:hypothetical protein
MTHDEIERLVTLLYRAQGECRRRRLSAEPLEVALGLVLAILMTTEADS